VGRAKEAAPSCDLWVTNRGKQQNSALGGSDMKTWSKPEVREQEVGLEVTSYLPAEIDII
jgi:coenzyme PQQ precursor peptide PqqA